MRDLDAPVVSLRDVERNYHGLRPLRVRAFDLYPGQSVAILGMERAPAEAFVNLVSAATLPDTGEVLTLGRRTSSVSSNEDWVSLLDRVGILSERAVLLGEMSVAQNLAMPFSLEVFEMSRELRAQVEALAAEVGLDGSTLDVPLSGASTLNRARVRLARALAASPAVLLAEHPNALVDPVDVAAFMGDLARVIRERRLAAIVLTADRAFARTVATVLLEHNAATGELTPASRWRRLWS